MVVKPIMQSKTNHLLQPHLVVNPTLNPPIVPGELSRNHIIHVSRNTVENPSRRYASISPLKQQPIVTKKVNLNTSIG